MLGLSNLHKHVNHFMDAFSISSHNGFNFEIFNNFPSNCCEFSSMMFARFLIEEQKYDFTDVLMVKGQCKINHHQSHLWLEVTGYVCDITAGQFEDAPERIIVAKKSSWHNRFQILGKNVPQICFDDYVNDYDELVLEQDYQQLIRKLPEKNSIFRE